MGAPEPIDIRPKLGNWAYYLLAVPLLVMCAAVPALYIPGVHVAQVAVGVAIFAALWFALSRLDIPLTVRLSPAGIELHREPGAKWIGGEKPALWPDEPDSDRELYWTLGGGGSGGVIPWQDVEKIGIFKFRGRKIVGVRVSSLDGFLDSQPPEPKSSKTLERAGQAVNVGLEILSLVHGGEDSGGFGDDADERPKVTRNAALAQRLAVNRRNWGYEFAFRYTDRDRSPDAFAELLRSYGAKARSEAR